MYLVCVCRVHQLVGKEMALECLKTQGMLLYICGCCSGLSPAILL